MFLGIDVGSTAIKIGVIAVGETKFSNSQKIATYQEGPAVYQKAEEILAALNQLISEIPLEFREQVSQIGVSCAMHSLLPVVAGAYDQVFLWSDQQANQLIIDFRETDLAEQFYLKTGTPIHPMSTFAKIWALKDSYPEKTSWFGLKELLLVQLTGVWQIDTATASATGLMNLAAQNWDAEILAFLGIERSQLAEIVAPTSHRNILPSLAKQWQISPQVKVMAGASDGCLAALAGFQGSSLPNSLTIGTSGAVRKLTKTPQFDVVGQNFCYRLDDERFVVGAPTNNGGCVLAWLQDFLQMNEADFYQEVARIAKVGEPGAAGLRFFPFVNGERAPYWQTDLTASFQNLTVVHKRDHLIKAVLEGLLQNIHSLVEITGKPEVLAISGGFFQLPELVQMTADVLGCPLALTAENEPVAGLYLLAGGHFDIENLQTVSPDPKRAAFYQIQHQTYFQEL